ncbi:MAG: TetR/AcrR family transcriptional regulator [Chitinispirillaceae bacterium]
MKAVQEKRMRGYFISAAKELIRGEGLEVVSARNVAQRAGYSYATLYNYFKDIRDLIFSCVQDFMEECRMFVLKDMAQTDSATEALIAISASYARFFIHYPGIFDLFYQTRATQISTPSSNFEAIYLLFDSLVAEQWQTIGTERKSTISTTEKAQRYHKLALHGLMAFYLNGRINNDYMELTSRIEEVTRSSIGMV